MRFFRNDIIKKLCLLFVCSTGIISCQSTSGKIDSSHPRIAYIAKLDHETFHDGIAKGVREEAATRQIEVDIFYGASQQDVEGQKNFIQDIIRSGKYTGVMLAPNDSEALIEDVENLDHMGMPFILIDTPLTDNDRTRSMKHDCGFVGTNNVLGGRLSAQFVASQLSSGKILLMRGNHKHQSSIDRENGFLAEIETTGKFTIMPPVQGWWEEETAYQNFFQYMKTATDLPDAVFAYNDPMALGVARYYDQHTELKRPIIIGVDGVLAGQRGILEKRISASVVQSPEIMGRIGVRNLLSCIEENRYDKNIVLTPVTLLKPGFALETMEVQ